PFISLLARLLPLSPLFPYTTLFRSISLMAAAFGLLTSTAPVPATSSILRPAARSSTSTSPVTAGARNWFSASCRQWKRLRLLPLDRKSTRLELQSPDHLVCRLLLEK